LREEIRADVEAVLEKYGENTEKEEKPLRKWFLIYLPKSIDIGMDLDYSDVPWLKRSWWRLSRIY
jgi:hypothetical protein